jgi:hypothetical protein
VKTIPFQAKNNVMTSLKSQAFCRIQPEWMMTATVSPGIVQLAFGLGNPICARWLATRGHTGQATTEDIEMSTRKGVFSSMGRAGVMATAVAVGLTAIAPSMATARSASVKGIAAGTSGATDFSSRGRHYHGGGGAAAAAAFAGIVGTGLAIAAANSRPDYYDSYGYYDAPPAYYGGGPVYYGGGPYYGGYGGYGSNPNYRPGGYNNPSAW